MENIPVNIFENFSLFQSNFSHAFYLNNISVHSYRLEL